MKQVVEALRRREFMPAFLLRIDLRIILTLFSLLLICGTWLGVGQTLDNSRKSRMEDARRDAQSLARLFLEHAYRTIEAADQAAIYLRYRFADRGTALNLASEVDNGLVARNVYNLFTVVNERGDVILSSKPFTPLNLADREHIRVHMDSKDDRLFISKPVLGRVSQRWSLQLTRRINQPDGGFGGVIVVSMDPQYFTRLYHEIDVGQFGAIALVGQDGVVRVRRTGSSDAMGESVAEGKIFQDMRQRSHGTAESTSSLDGRSRIYAFQKLPEYPLYAVVGIDLEERLAPYYKERDRIILIASLITASIIGFNIAMLWLATELLRSRRQALAANEAKSRFLSNMSHELRTPLNGVLGYADALREELGSSPLGEFANTIHQSGMRLLSTVEAILEVAALEDHRVTLALQEENLRELVYQAVARHSRAASDKGLELECNIGADAPQSILCDGPKVARVLDSLLSNAVRFTEQGRIVARVQRRDTGHLEIRVQDSGIGIDPQEQERIFEKFAQVDDSPNRKKDGAGLGLTIARRLATLMGGELALESTVNRGSTFVFTLPLNG